ncbi:MAG: sulfurtransferase TusA family protein [Promethearchaeati archaeon SRVP18_Atabeyarchaeia-1]
MNPTKKAPMPKPDKTLDLVGFYCPIPVYRTREETDKMRVGQVLEVLADDPAAEEDITRWAKRTDQEIISFTKSDDGKLRFLIRKKK